MTPEEMTPEQWGAYVLAGLRIAEAKAHGAKLLVLDQLVGHSEYEGETQPGDFGFNT